MKRIFLIVLDSFGVGALPDAQDFGDGGVSTLKSVSKSPFFNVPNLIKCGLGNIDGVDFIKKTDTPLGIFAIFVGVAAIAVSVLLILHGTYGFFA